MRKRNRKYGEKFTERWRRDENCEQIIQREGSVREKASHEARYVTWQQVTS